MTDSSAIHEIGHQAASYALGYQVLGCILGESARWCGLAMSVPRPVPRDARQDDLNQAFCQWPAELRDRIEGRAVELAAGQVAELTLGDYATEPPGLVTVAQKVMAEVTDVAEAVPGPSPELMQDFEAALADPQALSDDQALHRLAHTAHGQDLWTRAAWLSYVEAQARAIILAHAGAVRSAAAELETRGVLSGEQTTAILRANW